MSSEDFSLAELNKPKDWSKLTPMAKKHLPIIDAPEKVNANEAFQVKLKIGGIDEVEHPNLLGHWINWVILYAGLRPIAQVWFYPTVTDGYVVTINATLKESSTLYAQTYCNLHGVWEGKGHKITIL